MTVSNWERGKRRPEGPDGMEAVTHLCELLAVPAARAWEALGYPVPRADPRRQRPTDPELARIFDLLQRADRLPPDVLARIGTLLRDALALVDIHESKTKKRSA
jgi:hypothetical protein